LCIELGLTLWKKIRIQLVPEDEFFILGCDGIWDCLTNERAVEYVRQRIDHQTPAEIGASMLDDIISEDPRVTQGIGGDNMTIMIVDLQPQSRNYRRKQHTI
jgi:serine/threonine protein phosphatase PrpC